MAGPATAVMLVMRTCDTTVWLYYSASDTHAICQLSPAATAKVVAPHSPLDSSAQSRFIIMLETLSWELLYQICAWLMRDDIQVLALTCRTIARETKPLRFLSIRVTNIDLRILETLQSDSEIAGAVREVIFDLPGEFDPYTPRVSDETLSKCRTQ